MTRRELLTRGGLVAGALGCLALAAVLALLALDLGRWRDAVPAGDVRYGAAVDDGTWEPSTLLPRGATGALLGVREDVEFREALRAVRRSRLEDQTVSDPELAVLRSEAQARLEAIAGAPGDAARRSRAAALLGVLGMSRLVTETQQRDVLLQFTLANLERAIALDPGNAEAKLNLELALQRGRAIELAEGAGGRNPSPGGQGSRGAGTSDPGSGY
jgi:hypothetical protein